MDLNLKGKVALVSGSSQGVGKAIARSLLQEGVKVYISGRNEENLESTYKELEKDFPAKVVACAGDLTEAEHIGQVIQKIMDENKKLDMVIANIGTGKSVLGWDVDEVEWLRMFNINFFGAVKLCRESLRVMTEQESGNIVFISSIAGCETLPAPVPYSAAKSALLTYMKNTANQVVDAGIRLNAISPGNVYFPGGTWDRKLKEDKELVEAYLNESVPMKRLGKAEEIADVVTFLVSEKSSFITGSNLIVDGGQVKKVI